MNKFLTKEVIKETKSIIYIVLLAMAIRIVIFEPYYIPSSSMYDRLQVGDYLFGTKYNYGYSRESVPFRIKLFSGRIFGSEPQRGDIIIFRAKNTGMQERFIKRLIGIPGDKIRIENGDLYINDSKVQREYIGDIKDEEGTIFGKFIEILPNGKKYTILRVKTSPTEYEQGYKNNTITYHVPDKQYFFLGDNRDHSADSRFAMDFVDEEELIAKARLIYFSVPIIFFDFSMIFVIVAIALFGSIYMLYKERKSKKFLKNKESIFYLASTVLMIYIMIFHLNGKFEVMHILNWVKAIRFDRIFTTLS